ncbi:hypothetical protein FBGL_10510 [Flavobacterium glycines]|uniref:Uncharacterized protein n=1 Tax=Flavobacterium glycines TaxID=551990 RepID=A0A1B9DPR1_9FLAO|nr:hypothetical protein FBGL_10510 [Flavobacterium glycines]
MNCKKENSKYLKSQIPILRSLGFSFYIRQSCYSDEGGLERQRTGEAISSSGSHHGDSSFVGMTY